MRIYTTGRGRVGIRGGFFLVCTIGLGALFVGFFKVMSYLFVWLIAFAYEAYVVGVVRATEDTNRVFRR